MRNVRTRSRTPAPALIPPASLARLAMVSVFDWTLVRPVTDCY